MEDHKSVFEKFAKKGGYWVLIQFVLMSLITIAGPWAGHAMKMSLPQITVVLFLGFWCAFSGISGVWGLKGQTTPFPSPVEHGRLIRTGIYARIRHPLYSSVLSGALAWTFFWQSLPAMILSFLLMVLFWKKSRVEEKWLIQKYPEYTAYMKGTKKWIPYLW